MELKHIFRCYGCGCGQLLWLLRFYGFGHQLLLDLLLSLGLLRGSRCFKCSAPAHAFLFVVIVTLCSSFPHQFTADRI